MRGGAPRVGVPPGTELLWSVDAQMKDGRRATVRMVRTVSDLDPSEGSVPKGDLA